MQSFSTWDVLQQVAINRSLPVICSYQKDAGRNKNRGKSWFLCQHDQPAKGNQKNIKVHLHI